MSEPIRILIADDHPIVRQGLELVFSTHADLDIVAQAANGQEALQLAVETNPDVIVIDLQMPVKDGLQAAQEIKALGLPAKILVLTSFPDGDKVFGAIKAGQPEDFLSAVDRVRLNDFIGIDVIHQRSTVKDHAHITRQVLPLGICQPELRLTQVAAQGGDAGCQISIPEPVIQQR